MILVAVMIFTHVSKVVPLRAGEEVQWKIIVSYIPSEPILDMS